MARLTNIFFACLGLFIVGWSFYAVFNKPAPAKYQMQEAVATTTHTLKVNDYVLPVELADTRGLREQGFSGRERPLSGHGIVFVFEESTMPAFWMKDMRFPLDIIWIDEDWTVVGVERGVTPESFPQTFSPKEPILYVFELPAGDAAEFGIDTGVKLYLDQ